MPRGGYDCSGAAPGSHASREARHQATLRAVDTSDATTPRASSFAQPDHQPGCRTPRASQPQPQYGYGAQPHPQPQYYNTFTAPTLRPPPAGSGGGGGGGHYMVAGPGMGPRGPILTGSGSGGCATTQPLYARPPPQPAAFFSTSSVGGGNGLVGGAPPPPPPPPGGAGYPMAQVQVPAADVTMAGYPASSYRH